MSRKVNPKLLNYPTSVCMYVCLWYITYKVDGMFNDKSYLLCTTEIIDYTLNF